MKFKLGDQVEVVANIWGEDENPNESLIGALGEIVSIDLTDTDTPYLVDLGDDKLCFSEDELELRDKKGIKGLDKQIAEKVMGWKWNNGFHCWETETSEMVYPYQWRPSGSIETAFRVLEKMWSEGWLYALETCHKRRGEPLRYMVMIYTADPNVRFSTIAPTLAEGICEVTLEAVKAYRGVKAPEYEGYGL